MTLLIIALTLFVLKHFAADFVLQTPYMLKNKGDYGHPGGLYHVGIHLLFTGLILRYLDVTVVTFVGLLSFEFMIHYHMDWYKVRLNRIKGWTAQQREFWLLTGFDQLIHYLTYVVILAVVFIHQT
jgi:hypothetical protein